MQRTRNLVCRFSQTFGEGITYFCFLFIPITVITIAMYLCLIIFDIVLTYISLENFYVFALMMCFAAFFIFIKQDVD